MVRYREGVVLWLGLWASSCLSFELGNHRDLRLSGDAGGVKRMRLEKRIDGLVDVPSNTCKYQGPEQRRIVKLTLSQFIGLIRKHQFLVKYRSLYVCYYYGI